MIDELDVDVVIDSSKAVSWAIDSARWARRGGIDTAMVVTWKEPKALAFSFFKRDPSATSIEAALRSFRFYYSTVLALDIPMVAVRNEDLRSEPTSTVQALRTALDIADDGASEFWRSEHHHLFGSGSASEQLRASAPIPDPSPDPAFERAWRNVRESAEDAVGELSATLASIDVTVLERPIPGPIGTGRPPRAAVASTYAKQRLRDTGQRASLLLRTRRAQRTYP